MDALMNGLWAANFLASPPPPHTHLPQALVHDSQPASQPVNQQTVLMLGWPLVDQTRHFSV